MSSAVSTRLKRFTLVEKTAGQVGDGTEWPMIVTRSQLAEIMYRVRDARWTSGSAQAKELYSPFDPATDYFGNTVQFNSASPSNSMVEIETQSASPFDGAYTRRGYVTVINGESPDNPMSGYDTRFLDDVYYLTAANSSGGTAHKIAARDAASERGMWVDAYLADNNATVGHFRIGDATLTGTAEQIDALLYVPRQDTFRTGFSFFGASWTDNFVEPTIYAPYNLAQDGQIMDPPIPYLGASVELTFSGEVAWVDVNLSGNPFDPLNELYLGVILNISTGQDGTSGAFGFSTDMTVPLSFAAGSSDTGALLKLKLSGGVFVTAKIYGQDDGGTQYVYGDVTDWILEATEWWPYNRLDEPRSIWDAATGEFVPIGSTFAAFDLDNSDILIITI